MNSTLLLHWRQTWWSSWAEINKPANMADLEEIGNRNLGELPGNLLLPIRDYLDRSEQNSGWKAFGGVLDGVYTTTLEDLGALENEPSPTVKLLQILASRAMTIRTFVHYAVKYAEASEDYFILNLFNLFIPVEIIQQPLEEMDVLEGERVTLTVKARGLPPPKFQWYKNVDKIAGATSGTFCFLAESDNESGDYCCLVYNSNEPALLRLTRPVTVKVLPAPELEIKEHPRSCAITLGAHALFKCEVLGDYDVQYQWFLDNNMLQDQPDVIQGSNTNELRIYNVTSSQWVGCYTCLVTREPKAVMTKGAVLRIINLPGPVTNYTATDKVALLIGNYDYRSDQMLVAPKFDVQTLSNIFQSLGFKVVSLLNLTNAEMIAAVHQFRKLVGLGVYCVFYFCGHGFEIANQCYLVPTDARVLYTYADCVSADSIFQSLLQKEPQICCMILDICRKSRMEQTKPGILERDAVEKGNAIVCYGTSYGLAAYEKKQYGILVSHLKNILGQRYDIETVFKKLRDAIGNDPQVNHESRYKQIPEIRTNLLDVNRSFADPIVYRGHTEAFNKRQLLWDNAHRKPDPIELVIQFSSFTVTVKLDFQQEFSNVLKIYTLVLDPGPTQSCTAFVSAIPADVAEKAKVLTISHSKNSKLSKNYVVINNIQRLKSDMKISVSIICKGPDEDKTLTIPLGLPLVAQLKLWKERKDLGTKRQAEEVEESQEMQNFTAGFQDLNCR